MRTLDLHPVEAHTPTGDVLVDGGAYVRGVEAVLEDSDELSRFPALVSSARHRRIDPDIAMVLASRGSLCPGYRYDCLPHFSVGVYLTVLCRDEAPFMDPSSLERATTRVPGLDAALGANPYLAACPAWKVSPAAPTVHAPVDASVPVLTVTGRSDAFSPPSLTRELARSLANPFPIEVPDSTHNPLERTGCQLEIRDAWLEHPSEASTGTACLRQPSLVFTTR